MLDKLLNGKPFPTTFVWQEFPKAPQHEYARVSNPVRSEFEAKIAEMENGASAFATSSGQSAILLALSLLKAGDHVICAADVYDGTIRTLKVMNKFWVDFTLLAPEEFAELNKHIHPNTKMIIVETPSSTLLNSFDIRRIKSQIKRSHSEDAKLLVDNTVATPIFRKPLLEGADFVVHSLGKFIGGHDDLTGGVLVTKDDEHTEELKHLQHTLGAVLAPFDCSLAIQRIKTLEKRVIAQTENAKKISDAIAENRKIEQINFPGFSGLLSFKFAENSDATTFLSKVKIPIAQSYGGQFTRIQHPTTMINSSLDEQLKKKIGLDERLIRLGVGMENPEETIEKLENAIM